jgi:hypothetical protein
MKPKKCDNKYQFKSWKEAQEFSKEYEKQVSMSFHPMRPYFCTIHQVYHIGHDYSLKIDYTQGSKKIISNKNNKD